MPFLNDAECALRVFAAFKASQSKCKWCNPHERWLMQFRKKLSGHWRDGISECCDDQQFSLDLADVRDQIAAIGWTILYFSPGKPAAFST